MASPMVREAWRARAQLQRFAERVKPSFVPRVHNPQWQIGK
jgi:hypothetical protein